MIVATSDFNMGAMENKGLNVFNTKYVLASQSTATDIDYANIESVVGHEYFHNWTGNRVTCRDWFQLSLKEGLTVFRDQEFSMDMAGSPSARAVKRIEDVRVLRTAQFPEDAGPMAHPVRPDSYIEINNFYTVTIYEKGAEVVRMQHNLVGREGFAKGMKLYFERHDGHAVTCDDFAQAMADANPGSELAQRLDQFKRWYSQAGTPQLHAEGSYDAAARTYTLTLSQSCAPTPGQAEKLPFVIPVQMGLLGQDGRALTLRLQGEDQAAAGDSRLLVLSEPSHSFVFTDVDQEPVPSLLRGFSAPVVLQHSDSDAALLTLLAHDSDAFNRWEAGQRLGLRIALQAIGDTSITADASGQITAALLPASFIEAMRGVLRHPQLDAAFKELMLALPGESYIAEQLAVVDPQRVHAVREAMRQQLATELQADWQQAWQEHSDTGAYRPDPRQLRPPCAGWPGPVHAVPGRTRLGRQRLARQGAAALQGRRQHDRPHERPDGTGAKRPPAGSPGPGALSQAVPARCIGAGQVVRAAGRRLRPWRQRAAGRQAADEAPRLPDQEPQPRAQPDLQLLQRQPRRLPPRRRGGLCVLERARHRAGRHQPPGRRPPGARPGPLEQAGRALPHGRTRGRRPRGGPR